MKLFAAPNGRVDGTRRRSYRSHRSPDGRAGFSLAELSVVVMIVSIVAGIALPNIRSALFRADATHIVADVSTIRLAAYNYLGDNGVFPASGGYGVVPAEMESYLADGFEFVYKDVEYGWFAFNFPIAIGFWNTRTLGIVVVSFPNQAPLAEAMKSYIGPNAFWSTSLMWFVYEG